MRPAAPSIVRRRDRLAAAPAPREPSRFLLELRCSRVNRSSCCLLAASPFSADRAHLFSQAGLLIANPCQLLLRLAQLLDKPRQFFLAPVGENRLQLVEILDDLRLIARRLAKLVALHRLAGLPHLTADGAWCGPWCKPSEIAASDSGFDCLSDRLISAICC